MSVPNHPALASRSYKVARQLSHFRLFQPWARQHRAAELNTKASEVFREGADATYNLNGGFKPTMKRFADLDHVKRNSRYGLSGTRTLELRCLRANL